MLKQSLDLCGGLTDTQREDKTTVKVLKMKVCVCVSRTRIQEV